MISGRDTLAKEARGAARLGLPGPSTARLQGCGQADRPACALADRRCWRWNSGDGGLSDMRHEMTSGRCLAIMPMR